MNAHIVFISEILKLLLSKRKGTKKIDLRKRPPPREPIHTQILQSP